jgi:5-methylcytosine-specific restriction endonuclease McrA
MKCYSKFRKNKLPMTEQHAYKGIRKEGQSKQIYHQNYCRRHPKNISHLKSRRYARERNAIGSHTLQEWEDLKIEFNNRCAFCRGKKKLTKDHIIPLSEGGTDYIDNIQPLCRNCNSRKWKHIYENPELMVK